MRLLPLPGAGLRLRLDRDEAGLLDQLVQQLVELLRAHSTTDLDPDPLFASLEVGGSDETPDDPALARLFPDAFEDEGDSSGFRRLTEQGLVNRKLQEALDVMSELGVDAVSNSENETIDVVIDHANLQAWIRTLTSLRLAIAARIGLNADEDHARLLAEEQTRGTVMVYDWLAAILDAALHMADRE